MQLLKRIRVAGWKSIKDQTIDLTPLTVVIGANGAGKSNLLALFKLLNIMFAKTPGLRTYVGQSGYADSLLHYGTKQTRVAEMELTFSTNTGETSYVARWAAAARRHVDLYRGTCRVSANGSARTTCRRLELDTQKPA